MGPRFRGQLTYHEAGHCVLPGHAPHIDPDGNPIESEADCQYCCYDSPFAIDKCTSTSKCSEKKDTGDGGGAGDR